MSERDGSRGMVITVNGTKMDLGPDPSGTLLDWLRNTLHLVGTKNGCGVGQCGACTVLVDGAARTACTLKLAGLDGAHVETIEGLTAESPGDSGAASSRGLGPRRHPIQEAFIAEGAVQCGFCTPGMIMAAVALLNRIPHPSDDEIRTSLNGNLCRCTGYAAILRAVRRAAASMGGEGRHGVDPAGVDHRRRGARHAPTQTPPPTPMTAPMPTTKPPRTQTSPATPTGVDGVIGASPVRKDVHAKVLGHRVFADDYHAVGHLYGALTLSDRYHARVVAVNTGEATSLPGVVRVFTAADIPGRNGFGLSEPHQPVLADAVVRFRGEPVAFVVAETPEAARRGARRVAVRYEPLPVLHSPEEALAPGAPSLHPGGNVATTVRFRRGDVDAAFRRADVVVEGTYETPAVEHAYLEPESCLAVPGGGLPDDPLRVERTGRDGTAVPRITVYTATQGSGAYRAMIAATLALPEEEVRVAFTPAGGGFGGKEEPTVQIHAALAAHLLGRPVKVTLDRTASIRMSTKRHPSRISMCHAVRRDGTILGVESHVVCDAGAYLSLTRPVVFRTVVMAGGPYVIPASRLESRGVYTNTNPSGAFRGFGSTQICFASEMQMDKIARTLGIDPVELRRRNALAAGKTTVLGHRLSHGVGYLATIDPVADALRRAREQVRPAPGKRIGVGFASAYKNVGVGKGLPDEASAAVELGADGRVTVYVGATDLGQGSDTVMAQIAAATLGVRYDDVDVISSDTAWCPDAGMTTASRQTYISGNAVAAACRELLERGTRFAEVRYRPPATVHLPEVFEDAPTGPEGLPIHFEYCYTSMGVIVEIAPDGDGLRVLRLITAQDVGRALHRGNVVGQIEGAAVMGLGVRPFGAVLLRAERSGDAHVKRSGRSAHGRRSHPHDLCR